MLEDSSSSLLDDEEDDDEDDEELAKGNISGEESLNGTWDTNKVAWFDGDRK